jgi:DNA polymerase-3 subunit beta
MAITTHVLLRVANGEITLSATDLETGFEGSYPAQIQSEGNIAINARKLYEIFRDFPDENVEVHEVDNYWIEIGNDTVQYHIVGMNPDDFPENPSVDDIPLFEIDALAFKKMIERSVAIGGASDDKRAHILGVLLEGVSEAEGEDAHLMRIVATDGSRLNLTEYRYDDSVALPTETIILIPKIALHEMSKFLEAGETVQWGYKGNRFVIKKLNETLITRLLEGNFPAYKQILDLREEMRAENKVHEIVLDRQLFLMMLRRMSILSSENYKGVIFTFDQNRLTINSTNPDIGESKEDMAINFPHEKLEMAFNPRFFIDALNHLEDEKILISFVDEEKPCLVEGEEEKAYLGVIMPMRI